jgi:predicted nucleic acid-binding protein
MTVLDTNVLLYAHDPRDQSKQQLAIQLIQSVSDGVLMWQVACEYLAASAKLEPFGYNRGQAWQDIEELQTVWTSIVPPWSAINRARALMQKYSLPFWDAMLLGACVESGVTKIYSQDFDAYAEIDGVGIVNPFKGASAI